MANQINRGLCLPDETDSAIKTRLRRFRQGQAVDPLFVCAVKAVYIELGFHFLRNFFGDGVGDDTKAHREEQIQSDQDKNDCFNFFEHVCSLRFFLNTSMIPPFW